MEQEEYAPEERQGLTLGQRIKIGAITLSSFGASYCLINTAIVYQQTTARVLACVGVLAGWSIYGMARHAKRLRDERDEAVDDLMTDGDRNTLRITRGQLDYYIERTHQLEEKLVELRAQLAEAKVGTKEAGYWVDKYRPTVKVAPEEVGTVKVEPETHKYQSNSGRSGADQRQKAYELSLIGKKLPEIAEELGVSKSTAERYIRDGKRAAKPISIPNPRYDRSIPSNWPHPEPETLQLLPGTDDYIEEIRRRYEADESA